MQKYFNTIVCYIERRLVDIRPATFCKRNKHQKHKRLIGEPNYQTILVFDICLKSFAFRSSIDAIFPCIISLFSVTARSFYFDKWRCAHVMLSFRYVINYYICLLIYNYIPSRANLFTQFKAMHALIRPRLHEPGLAATRMLIPHFEDTILFRFVFSAKYVHDRKELS